MIKRLLAVFAVLGLAVGLFAAPASATSIPPYQATRTIVVHLGVGLPAGSSYYNAMVSQASYLSNIGGKPIKVVFGSCQPGFECVDVNADHYGASWAGYWAPGPSCNYSGTAWSSTDYHFHCIWDAVNQYRGNIYFDTHDVLTDAQKRILACHELGHMVGLWHSGGAYCMQATIDATPTSTSNTYSGADQLALYNIYINYGIPNCCPDASPGQAEYELAG